MDSALKNIGNFISTESGAASVYLDTLDELINSNTSQRDINHALETTNFLLSKAKTRFLGLEILDKILLYIDQETLEQKLSIWTTLILKACNQDNLLRHGNLLYKTLTNFAILLQQQSDLSKNFATNHLNKIFEIIILAPAEYYIIALKCATEFLKMYPKLSGQCRDILERFLRGFPDTLDDEVNHCVGKCLHLLQQTSAPGSKFIKAQEQWKKYQLYLIDTISDLLEGTYEELNRFDKGRTHDVSSIPSLKLSTEPDTRAAQLFVRFHNLTIYLRKSLCEPNIQSSKPIMAKKIINLISHGLISTCAAINQEVTYSKNVFGVFLTKVQIDLLELMKGLVHLLHSHLRIYYKSILSTLTHVIKSISPKNKTVRTEVYKVITLWCQTLREGSRCELYADDLVPEILKDITPVKNELLSQVNVKKTSKKAYQLAPQIPKENVSIAFGKKYQILLAPIACLNEIVKACSCFLKPTTFTSIQMGALKICTSFSITKRNDMYNHWESRLEMYKLLKTLLMAPNQHCPPPCEIILYIIQRAQLTDNNAEIRLICSNMFADLEKIIHPQKESLLFPIEARVMRNAYHKLGAENLLEQKQCSFSNLNYETRQRGDKLEVTSTANHYNSVVDNTMRTELFEVNDEGDRENSPYNHSEAKIIDDNLSNELLTKPTVPFITEKVRTTPKEDEIFMAPATKKARTDGCDESSVNSSFSSEESMESESFRPRFVDYIPATEMTPKELEKDQHLLDTLESCENEDYKIAEMEACFVDELKEIF